MTDDILSAPPPEGQLRAGAHTDYGSLTILLPQPGSRGLEILTPEGAFTAENGAMTPLADAVDFFWAKVANDPRAWNAGLVVATHFEYREPPPRLARRPG